MPLPAAELNLTGVEALPSGRSLLLLLAVYRTAQAAACCSPNFAPRYLFLFLKMEKRKRTQSTFRFEHTASSAGASLAGVTQSRLHVNTVVSRIFPDEVARV